MFEILTKEQVEKMSDRELMISEDYYRHNLNEITNEADARSQATTDEPLSENKDSIFEGAIDGNGEFVTKEKIKTRGRKKKIK